MNQLEPDDDARAGRPPWPQILAVDLVVLAVVITAAVVMPTGAIAVQWAAFVVGLVVRRRIVRSRSGTGARPVIPWIVLVVAAVCFVLVMIVTRNVMSLTEAKPATWYVPMLLAGLTTFSVVGGVGIARLGGAVPLTDEP